jgi:hypothetical protein
MIVVKTQEKPIAAGSQSQPSTPASHKPIPQPPKPAVARRIPFWASASIAINGLLLLGISLVYWKPERMGVQMPVPPVEESAEVAAETETAPPDSDRQQLSYEEWLKVLEKEAKAAAQNKPDLVGRFIKFVVPAGAVGEKSQLVKSRHFRGQYSGPTEALEVPR